jgi:hypothetical protein
MGDHVLYFEDIGEGDEAPVRTLVLDRTDLVVYAGASGDYNPMHHDEVKAKQAGQPSVFGHGMFSMAQVLPWPQRPWPGSPCSVRTAAISEPQTRLIAARCLERGPGRCRHCSPPERQ